MVRLVQFTISLSLGGHPNLPDQNATKGVYSVQSTGGRLQSMALDVGKLSILSLPTGKCSFLQLPVQLGGFLYVWQREWGLVSAFEICVSCQLNDCRCILLMTQWWVSDAFFIFQKWFPSGQCSTSRFFLWTRGSAIELKATAICFFLPCLVWLYAAKSRH